MPALFYGDASDADAEKGRHLYLEGLRRTETPVSIWDSFRIDGLAAYPLRHAVANIWHMPRKRHTAISWSDTHLPHEQTIFLPGLLDQREALELARVTFDRVVPSPIIFRLRQDYHEVLVYD